VFIFSHKNQNQKTKKPKNQKIESRIQYKTPSNTMIEFVAYCVFAFLVILWLLCVLQQPRLSKKEEFMALLEVQIHEDPVAE